MVGLPTNYLAKLVGGAALPPPPPPPVARPARPARPVVAAALPARPARPVARRVAAHPEAAIARHVVPAALHPLPVALRPLPVSLPAAPRPARLHVAILVVHLRAPLIGGAYKHARGSLGARAQRLRSEGNVCNVYQSYI